MPESSRPTNTFRASWRNKHLELRELTDSEFRLNEFYIDDADWEERHADFGKSAKTDKEVAEKLGWSESKVNRNRNGLIRKGELVMEGNKKVIPNFKRYRHPYDHFKKLAKLQGGNAELQEQHADLQAIEPISSSNISPISRYKDSFKDEFNRDSPSYKEDWRDWLVGREMAKELCFCGSGRSLENCCGLLVHESLENSEEMRVIHHLDKE